MFHPHCRFFYGKLHVQRDLYKKSIVSIIVNLAVRKTENHQLTRTSKKRLKSSKFHHTKIPLMQP